MLKRSCLLILLLLSPLFALNKKYIKEFDKLSIRQKSSLIASYSKGLPHNLGWSMMAHNWQESNGGRYLVNLQDPSCGPYHNNINSVIARHAEIEDTPFKRNVLCTRLMTDFDFASNEAIAELQYWLKYHNGDFNKVWGSWNGGYKGNPKYSKIIKERIQVLKYKMKGIK